MPRVHEAFRDTRLGSRGFAAVRWRLWEGGHPEGLDAFILDARQQFIQNS